jgi:hypothetical protein
MAFIAGNHGRPTQTYGLIDVLEPWQAWIVITFLLIFMCVVVGTCWYLDRERFRNDKNNKKQTIDENTRLLSCKK